MSSPRRLIAVVLGALTTACGGAGETAPPPALGAATAEALAGRADQLATRLAAGDACGAVETADGLVRAAEDGLVDGSVPGPVATEIIRTTRSAVHGVTCAPPPPTPSAGAPAGDDRGDDRDADEDTDDDGDEDRGRDEDGPGRGKPGKGKPGKGRGGGGD